MAKNRSTVIILVVLIAAAVLLVPTALSGLSDAWSRGWTDFWDLFKGASSNSASSLGFTIEYVDGSTREFVSNADAPMTILTSSSDLAVKIIRIVLYCHLEGTAEISFWHITGEAKLAIVNGADVDVSSVDRSGSTWLPEKSYVSVETGLQSFVGAEIFTKGFLASTIESKLASSGYGTYTLQASAQLNAQVEFGNLDTDEASVEVQSTLQITYAASPVAPGYQITAFTAQIYPDRF